MSTFTYLGKQWNPSPVNATVIMLHAAWPGGERVLSVRPDGVWECDPATGQPVLCMDGSRDVFVRLAASLES